MKKNKNIKSIFLIIVLSIVLSFIIDFFGYNYNILKLDSDSRKIYSIFDKVTNNNELDETMEISINLKDVYINKFIIDYSSKEKIDYKIEFICNDFFNNKKECLIEDTFNEKLNSTITNINDTISTIKITVDENVVINDISIDNKIQINFFRIIYFAIIIFLFIIIIYFYKNNLISRNLETIFLIISVLLGSLIVILQPSATFYSWDDQIHFERSIKTFDNNIYWSSNLWQMKYPYPFEPYSIDSKEEQIIQTKYLNSQNTIVNIEKHRFLIKYSEIAYVPSSIGIKLANILKLPYSIKFKIGKLMNVLFYSLVMFIAIKISKIKKRLLFVIGLIPTTIFMSAQYSYDPPITACLCLATVTLLNEFIEKNKKISILSVCIFLVSIIIACFTKAIYAPLIFLMLFLPKEKFRNNKQQLKFKTGILLIGLLLLSTFILPTLTSADVVGDLRGGNTSVSGQLSLIIKNPLGYLLILKNNMGDMFFYKLFAKETLGNFSYVQEISDNMYYMFLILLMFVGFTDNDKKYDLPNYFKYIMALMILGIILFIWTALYLSFTPVGNMVINGVQGRYFIPLLFPLFIVICPKNIFNNITIKKYDLFIIMILLIVLSVSIYQNILSVYCF